MYIYVLFNGLCSQTVHNFSVNTINVLVNV